MSQKKDKEKRFQRELNDIVQQITRINVKPNEVLLIEIDPKIKADGFAMISRTLKKVFEPDKVKIIFGAAGTIKNITAIGGKGLKKLPDSDPHKVAAKVGAEMEAADEKSKESFTDYRERVLKDDE